MKKNLQLRERINNHEQNIETWMVNAVLLRSLIVIKSGLLGTVTK